MTSFNDKITKITGRDNQKIKFARSVRDGYEQNNIFIEGIRLCEESLKANLKINRIFFTAKFAESLRGAHFLDIAAKEIPELIETEEKIFNSLSDTKNSQGIALIADKPRNGKEIIENTFVNKIENALFLLLHQINNPANLGAMLRTAEAVGVTGIITTKNTTDVFSPKSLRGAMGAVFRIPLWTKADYFEVLEWAQNKKINSVCADVNSSKSYLEIDWKIPRLLVFGSEGHGLTIDEFSKVDESLIIPMSNDVESLNVAIACGVILFEAKRQRNC